MIDWDSLQEKISSQIEDEIREDIRVMRSLITGLRVDYKEYISDGPGCSKGNKGFIDYVLGIEIREPNNSLYMLGYKGGPLGVAQIQILLGAETTEETINNLRKLFNLIAEGASDRRILKEISGIEEEYL